MGAPRRRFRQLWLWWAFVGLLAVLCGALGVVQSRWLDEISNAEQDRLRAALNLRLDHLSRDFDGQIGKLCAGLIPGFHETQERGSLDAVSLQYQQWKQSNGPIFQRIGLVRMQKHEPLLYLLDLATGKFARAEWPTQWSGAHQRFETRVGGRDWPSPSASPSALLEFSLFGSVHGRLEEPRGSRDLSPSWPPAEDWLLLELNTAYVRSTLLPQLLLRHFGEPGATQSGETQYDARVVMDSAPGITVIDSTGERFERADATTGLLNPGRIRATAGLRGPPGPGGPGGPPREHEPRSPSPDSGPSRWRLLIHERGNSLDGQIAQARRTNFAISAGILSLILTTVVVLLHFSRKSEQLAELQMNFVAGVSHELQTPLTVIRTAAFNLRGKVATRPEQVERYGALIQNESEKLSLLVNQVLTYGAAKSGRVIGPRVPVAIDAVIERSLQSSSVVSALSNVVLERRINPDLPTIMADEVALRHALQNLIENAVKHGLDGSNWIGIRANLAPGSGGCMIEISVSDRGPGIPREEQVNLFDAFYRGKRALRDQVHGTGLGLNIVKSIIEAHGGTVRLISEPPKGATFIVRLPAAPQDRRTGEPQEAQHGIANLIG